MPSRPRLDEAPRQAPNRNFADLISHVPGGYLFERTAYDSAEGFREDMDWTQRFCQEHGFAFEAIRTPASSRVDAFSVWIGRE